MAAPRIVFVTPPVIKPCEAGLSGAAAASYLAGSGIEALWIDANMGWLEHSLSKENLASCLGLATDVSEGQRTAYGAAAKAMAAANPLRQPATYRHRPRYTSAVNHLDNALRLASLPWPGLRLRIGNLELADLRPASSRHILRFAAYPGPFDGYYEQVLLPRIAASGASRVAISLSFYNQAFAGFRLAALLRERLPALRCLLGGPLVACWTAAGADLGTAPFQLFQGVEPRGDDLALDELARELGGQPGGVRAPRSVPLEQAPWSSYLAPEPIVPAALGRGCYWRRCAFCPDHLHPRYRACQATALQDWLRAVAARFPRGAMLHLTDSALPPAKLARIATQIRDEGLPLRWHGFVRFERDFADPDFARLLAQGGAAMLQFGLENASPRLLQRLDKGFDLQLARQVLRSTATAGIRNHVYLLFGQPLETDEDRELTLEFVQEEATHIHDLNNALLNLPRGSPMHRQPARWGISQILPFGVDTDLSLYDDFRCGDSHPRLEARRWLGRRFFKSAAVRAIQGDLRSPFKANHACFLD